MSISSIILVEAAKRKILSIIGMFHQPTLTPADPSTSVYFLFTTAKYTFSVVLCATT